MSNIDEMIEKARIAQERWEKSSQEAVDKVVREIAKTVYDNAEMLAEKTVEETRLGNVKDNVMQCRRKAEIIWYSLKGKKSRGIINTDIENEMVEIAKPAGVIGVLLPVTIPVTNFMSNSMFALKCGNSVIHAPHPAAEKIIALLSGLVNRAISKFDVPADIIQYIREPTKETSRELMGKVNVVVATGGMAMVKAAYSSGRPAYGVGPGNVQAIIDVDADIKDAVKKIIDSRTFNYGIPCASEQAVIVPRKNYGTIIDVFISEGAVLIKEALEIKRLKEALFDEDGVLSKKCIGISAHDVAKNAAIDVPEETRVLILNGDIKNPQFALFRREKLCPVTVIYVYDTFSEAVEIAKANLEIEGKGHSVAIHSFTKEHIEQLAGSVYTSRVIVNQASNFNAGGGFNIGFAPTTTLGCGSWENNIISENLTYKHLMNVTRIGYPIKRRIPDSKEIWG